MNEKKKNDETSLAEKKKIKILEVQRRKKKCGETNQTRIITITIVIVTTTRVGFPSTRHTEEKKRRRHLSTAPFISISASFYYISSYTARI